MFPLSDASSTVASVVLGNLGEQPAFSFQINAPGVNPICQMAYVHHSKSLVHFLLLFYKNKECPQIQLRKMLDFGKQMNLNDIGTAKSKFIFTFHRVIPAS